MIGYVCKYAPLEIFEAMGTETGRIQPQVTNFNQADTLMHPNVCSFAKAVLEEVMTKIMYSVPSDPTIVKVTITASCVTDGADPEIVRDPERRQRPRLGKASLRAERGGAVGTNAG